MIDSIEQLKTERPDLVESFNKMTRDQLMDQCYLECIDAINMEERVSLFMQECTIDMSKTNYTIESLKTMISDRKDYDISEFCYGEIVDDPSIEELSASIRDIAATFEV